MLIRRLEITNVRNLLSVSLTDLSDINVLYGFNGSGKTSVLESIYLLSLAKSFRGHKVAPLINTNAVECVVYGEILVGDRFQSIGVERHKKQPGLIKLGGKAVRSSSKLAEVLPVQVINSDTFRLLEGSPVVRRQFLDWGVFHVEQRFHAVWKSAQRCLKQRNSLLRHDRIDDQQLSAWTEELAKAGEQIDAYRKAYFEAFLPAFNTALSQLLDLDGLTPSYYRGWDKGRSLSAVLSDSMTREQQLGYTQSGPHRADIRFRYNGDNAADVLSRGQQKLVVCAMRIAQARLLEEMCRRPCVFLIDDLPAELDDRHRNTLCSLLEQMNCQVFITCVDYKDLEQSWSGNNKINVFHVEHGQVSLLSN